MSKLQNINPFDKSGSTNALAEVQQGRAMQEVQAAVIMAKQFPRDQRNSMNRILDTCTRETLANQAIYAYPRGGQQIEGPSIRLAEAIAQNWGNFEYGVVELEQNNGVSICLAYAWDLETNTRKTINFHVEHVRFTRASGKKVVLDPRDIYEIVSNQGSRRVRNCILAVVPGDVVEAAVNQCKVTQASNSPVTPEVVQATVEAFEKYGVSKEMINKRLGHPMDAMKSPQLVALRRIFQSIKDGIGKVSDFFDEESRPKQAPELPAYTDSEFLEKLSQWRDIIDAGKSTPDRIIAMVSNKVKLTANQIEEIKKLANPAHAQETTPIDTGQPDEPETDQWVNDYNNAEVNNNANS